MVKGSASKPESLQIGVYDCYAFVLYILYQRYQNKQQKEKTKTNICDAERKRHEHTYSLTEILKKQSERMEREKERIK